jgi:hypothetical protein
MALWGNNDNVSSVGIVTCDYVTKDSDGNVVVIGSGTSFGQVGSAKTGDVIRFGLRSGSYMGDAVIVSIASTEQISIASTAGLSGVAIAGTSFTISELPIYTIVDSHYSEASSPVGPDADTFVYGVELAGKESASTTKYELTHTGWVGVTTYVDCHGEFRVKKETLVAMSGITTGNPPIYDNDPLV